MELQETYTVERDKWDALAEAALEEPELTVLPYPDYAAYASSKRLLAGVAEFLGDLRGRRVLEYGCGMGQVTPLLARSGAEVSAFDLSPASVAVTRRRLAEHGLEADVVVAPGEDLPYEDEQFDVVVGEAILHHVDPALGAPELRRVLRPGGRAAFSEPMGMNPAINFVRDHVPYRDKTPRGADVPLTYDDIATWGEHYRRCDVRELQLLSSVERFFGWHTELPSLWRADERLLRSRPRLRRLCRYCVVTLER